MPILTRDLQQIIPAPGWYAHTISDGEHRYEPLVAWGLDAYGEVVGLVADCDVIVNAYHQANDLGDEWRGYVNSRDTPEGIRRQKRLDTLENALAMDDKTAVRSLSSVTIAAHDATERGEDLPAPT